VSKHPADLIIQSLGGQHLYGFLPGHNRPAAISRLVASKHECCGPGFACAVTRDGIGEWATIDAARSGCRGTALTFVTWAEALAMIERGCADGHRERCEAAYRAWRDGVRQAHNGWLPGADWFPAIPPTDAIHATTAALIRHGADLTTVQDTLF
jgi:hypothetical protein